MKNPKTQSGQNSSTCCKVKALKNPDAERQGFLIRTMITMLLICSLTFSTQRATAQPGTQDAFTEQVYSEILKVFPVYIFNQMDANILERLEILFAQPLKYPPELKNYRNGMLKKIIIRTDLYVMRFQVSKDGNLSSDIKYKYTRPYDYEGRYESDDFEFDPEIEYDLQQVQEIFVDEFREADNGDSIDQR